MNAAQIRELCDRYVSGGLDGALDEANLRNALLGEIAAHLAEMNEFAHRQDTLNRDAIYSEASQLRKVFVDHLGTTISAELRAFADARLEKIRRMLK